jgi:hypothetical protein
VQPREVDVERPRRLGAAHHRRWAGVGDRSRGQEQDRDRTQAHAGCNARAARALLAVGRSTTLPRLVEVMRMALAFVTLHRAEKPELLNEEWIVLENTGPGLLNSGGWSIEVSRGKGRPRPLGQLKPGFVLQAGEKIRLVTGTASKKAQGAPPVEEGLKNYFLFLREPLLAAKGIVLHVRLNQHELARAQFDPDAKSGIASA